MSGAARIAGWREWLEHQQVALYLAALAGGALVGWLGPGAVPAALIDPAIALMLYATFLQVPMRALWRGWGQGRFLLALGVANFVLLPLLVWALAQALPATHPQAELMRLGLMLVLLAPCIDYVVTFAHLGRADARLLLAATPLLLIAQMLLLPPYLHLMLGEAAARRVQAGPFVQAFVWLIAVPLLLAALTQAAAARQAWARRVSEGMGLLPVPATAGVLFVVVAALLAQLGPAREAVWRVAPLYLLFAMLAPLAGWAVARALRLPAPAGRAVAFSAGTRNALVVLPLALAVPGGGALLPAVVLTQTFVELLAELAYVRVIARWGAKRAALS
ncbi:bile acid:sodium symporter [Xenophilus arseniciresistens]|uniref:Bile acid:sodium symporter n=1 Tax=Xenophilus arseniciresistens TaxID=1283306 RepID=A0AAE3T226_9BURK|nr:bile acid:sodium symporter [Xenophilus arseniciresistens]MDA7418611.1 bile acid:sodium symporter [Xenophilus arseniciresistens]